MYLRYCLRKKIFHNQEAANNSNISLEKQYNTVTSVVHIFKFLFIAKCGIQIKGSSYTICLNF